MVIIIIIHFSTYTMFIFHEVPSKVHLCNLSIPVTHAYLYGESESDSDVHTHSNEHTPRAVGSHLCCGARGAVGGSVSCSRTPQSWYWGWRARCTFTPPTYNSCRTWDSNSQPLDYEPNSLTIRPRLPWYGTNMLPFRGIGAPLMLLPQLRAKFLF